MSHEEMGMKEELYAWFQRLIYEEGVGHGEVFSFLQHKRKIETYTIPSALDHSER